MPLKKKKKKRDKTKSLLQTGNDDSTVHQPCFHGETFSTCRLKQIINTKTCKTMKMFSFKNGGRGWGHTTLKGETMTCDTGPGHTLLGHAALGDLFSDFFFFFLLLFFHLRSCQECGQWDSQAARVTVHQYQHDHHQYHHYCHHRYCHPPHGIIIIIIILIFFIIIFDVLLRLENNLHHVFY